MFHKTPIRAPDKTIRIALRLEEWPEEDRARWQRAIDCSDIFGDYGAAAGWRPATRRRAVDAYGRLLGEFARHDAPALRLGTTERVTRDRITWFCGLLSETNGGISVANHLRAIRETLVVMAPEGDWAWLLTIAKQIAHQSHPRSKSNRIRSSADIWSLGLELMDAAEAACTGARANKSAGLNYRDGLMLALLAHAPIRRSNLAGLEVGRTLLRQADRWLILLPAAEMKSGRDEEHLLPASLTSRIERYLAMFRPSIPGSATHKGFWASAKCCPLPADGAYQAICRRTQAKFGVEISPHLLRDCLMTTWALENPDQIRAASALLGHADPKTGQRHYNQARSISAARRLARSIAYRRL